MIQVSHIACRECGDRLREKALSPLEWFNLAARHGPAKFLLHDDFYDQDGTATQSRFSDASTNSVPAPSLTDASRDLTSLLDYCVTRWGLEPQVYEALKSFPVEALLEELRLRARPGNRYVLGVTFNTGHCAN